MIDKLERLMDLVITLLETEHLLSAEQIKSRVPGYPDKLESFRRAFERDKEELRDLGIPLKMDYIAGTDPPLLGYCIPKDEYYLADPGLDAEELVALHLAASMVDLEGTTGDNVLWGLGGIPRVPGSDAVGQFEVALPGDPNLAPIFGAIQTRSRISFEYNTELREVDPYRLDFQHGWWYLTALDHFRNAQRTFRVDRITGSVAIGSPGAFDRPINASAEFDVPIPWELGEGDPVTAILLVDAHQAGRALAELGEERISERRADGSIVFEVPVVNWPAFRFFVLGLLEHAEVIGPAQWRTDFERWLVALCE